MVNECVYVQASYLLADEGVREREFRNLEKIKDARERLVVSLDDLIIEHPNGIKHLRLWEL